MSRIKNLFAKIPQSALCASGWVAFLLGLSVLSPDLLVTKILLLSVARVLP